MKIPLDYQIAELERERNSRTDYRAQREGKAPEQAAIENQRLDAAIATLKWVKANRGKVIPK